MSNKEYKVYVYNTFTGKHENTEVSKEVYQIFKRTEWNIKDNNKSFYKHEIQFSGLTGGENNAFENFKEFITSNEHICEIIENKLLITKLRKSLQKLSVKELRLLKGIYLDGLSEREYAIVENVKQQTIHTQKKRILKKIRKYLK